MSRLVDRAEKEREAEDEPDERRMSLLESDCFSSWMAAVD